MIFKMGFISYNFLSTNSSTKFPDDSSDFKNHVPDNFQNAYNFK